MKNKKFKFLRIFLCSLFVITSIISFINNKQVIYADEIDASNECTKDAVLQLAKIIYKEVGGDSAADPELNFYRRITTGSIVLNNASTKSGTSWYEKIYNLTNNNYEGYSNYKDASFESATSGATDNKKGEVLYMAELIMSGKYNVPKNLNLQANYEIVNRWGTIWDSTESNSGWDVYFGHEQPNLSNEDVFGNTISDTSAEYFRKLAESLKQDDYTKYTADKVCKNNLSGGSVTSGGGEYTVNFYLDQASTVIYHSTSVNEGATVNMPSAPTKEGYKFAGWIKETGSRFNAISRVSSDINLYASWTEKTDTINIFGTTCGGAEILKVIKFIWTLLDIVLFIVPIGLIVMISIDLAKNVIAGKEDEMKKNFNIAIKRIIFCIFLFLVEPICSFAIDLLGDTADMGWATCVNIATDPNTDFSEYEVNLENENN